MIRILVTVCVLLLASAAVAFVEDDSLEAEQLWLSYQHGALDRLDPQGRLDEARAMVERAAALIARHEAGVSGLDQRAYSQLMTLINHLPLETATASGPRSGTPGTLSGTVTEAGTGLPLQGISIQAINFSDPFSGMVSQPTDSNGEYTLSLDPGFYVLRVGSAPDHVRQAWPGLACESLVNCPIYSGDVIEVSAGVAAGGYHFELEPGIRVEGQVTAGGSGVANVSVQIGHPYDAQFIYSTVTDIDGNYQLSAVSAGDYRLVAIPPSGSGLAGRIHDGQPCGSSDCRVLPLSSSLAVSGPGSSQVQDFDLEPGGSISGQVTLNAGGPLEEAFVSLSSVDGWITASAQTDAVGSFSIEGLPPGDYRLVASHPMTRAQAYPGVDCFPCAFELATPITVIGGSNFTGIDFDLSDAGGSISGQVLRADNGNPVVGARAWASGSGLGGRWVETDSNGEFTIPALNPGSYYLRVDPPTGENLQPTFFGDVSCAQFNCGQRGQVVVLDSGADVTGLVINAPAGGGLTGTVTRADLGIPMSMMTIARLELFAASGPDQGRLVAQQMVSTTPGVTPGVYEISGLPPGAYKAVFATSTPFGYIDTAFGGQPCPRGGCNLDLLPTVFVTSGVTLPGIGAALGQGPVIRGTVSDIATGLAPVRKPSDPGGLIGLYNTLDNYASFGVLDGRGNWHSRTGLPDGTYYVATFLTRNNFPFGGGFVDQAYDDVDCPWLGCSLIASATALDVTGADISGIDFELRTGGAISGTVTDGSSSEPLLAVLIEAYQAGGVKVAESWTNILGEYQLSGLPAGDYFVRTRNDQNFQDQLYSGINCTPFCDPVNGAPINVSEGSDTTGIDFVLIESGSISGEVRLGASPVSGVTVEIYGAIGNLLSTTTSGSDGSYQFNNLSPGSFYLRTRNTLGHADVLYDGLPCVGTACRVRDGDAVAVGAGGVVSGIDLLLTAGASISGTVRDAVSTSALSGVRVQLLDDRGAVAAEQTTNASGNYSFGALAAGDYHLVTRGTPGYVDMSHGNVPCPSACNGLNGVVVTVSAGGSAGGTNFDLPQGESVSGNVMAGGSPAVGALVQLYNDSGIPVAEVLTNPSGNYEITNLPDGDYFIRVWSFGGFAGQLYNGVTCTGYCDVLSADPVAVSTGNPAASINFSLTPAGSISGTVTAAGAGGLGLVGVQVWDQFGFIAGTATTNAAGQYTVSGLQPGQYRVRTTNQGGFVDQVFGGDSCSPTPCAIDSGTAITVGTSTVSGINFALQPGSSISGTATDSFGNPLPTGLAVLFDVNGIDIDTAPIVDGLWRFDGLADGTYYVLIENGVGLVDELWQDIPCPAGVCDITAGTPIIIGGREAGRTATTGINVVLDAGNTISGRVTDAGTGAGILGARVFIFDDQGQLVGDGFADALGDYQTQGGFPAGTYHAATASGMVRGVGSNYINALYAGQPCLLDCDVTAGTAIDLTAGSATGINFALSTGAGLKGRVSTANDAPVVQIEVRVYDSAGTLAGIGLTNSQGRFTVDGLPAGSYTAHTINTQGLEDQAFGGELCGTACQGGDGTPFAVPASGFVENINFELFAADVIFIDGFE